MLDTFTLANLSCLFTGVAVTQLIIITISTAMLLDLELRPGVGLGSFELGASGATHSFSRLLVTTSVFRGLFMDNS